MAIFYDSVGGSFCRRILLLTFYKITITKIERIIDWNANFLHRLTWQEQLQLLPRMTAARLEQLQV